MFNLGLWFPYRIFTPGRSAKSHSWPCEGHGTDCNCDVNPSVRCVQAPWSSKAIRGDCIPWQIKCYSWHGCIWFTWDYIKAGNRETSQWTRHSTFVNSNKFAHDFTCSFVFTWSTSLHSHPIGYPDLPQFRLVDMFTSGTHLLEKESILLTFTIPDSAMRVLIATIAFGMGVNSLDVRYVLHLMTLHESYVQEIGRGAWKRCWHYLCNSFLCTLPKTLRWKEYDLSLWAGWALSTRCSFSWFVPTCGCKHWM